MLYLTKIEGDILKRIIILLVSLLFVTNVHADKCTYDQKVELAKLANNIKVDYEEINETEHVIDGYNEYDIVIPSLYINIYNISKEFMLEISNDYNSEQINILSSNFNEGKYSFQDFDINKIINYEIKVYNNSDICDNYVVKTIKYKKPMINPNYTYDICKENQEISFCSKYITNEKKVYSMGIGLQQAVLNAKKYQNTIIDNTPEKENWFIKNWKYILGGTAGIITLSVALYLINKKRSEL